jgi:hypothetical protein
VRPLLQDFEKENVYGGQAKLTKSGQQALEKLESLSLNQEALHASKKKTKRSMFNSFGDNNESTIDNIYDINSKTVETKRRLFTQNSNELVDIDTDQDNILTVESHLLVTNFNDLSQLPTQVSHTPISKRTRNVTSYKKDIDTKISNSKQTKGKRNNKSIFDPIDDSQENMITENNEISQVYGTLTMTSNDTGSGVGIRLSKKCNKVTKATRVSKKKSKSISPNSCRKCTNVKIKSKSISPDKSLIDLKNNDKKLSILHDVLHTLESIDNQVQPALCLQNDDNSIKNLKIQQGVQFSSLENLQENLEPNDNENKVNISSKRYIILHILL